MILRYTVKTAQEVQNIIAKLKSKYRRLTADRYDVCIGIRGITLVPYMSSRHAHVIEFLGLEDPEELEKAIEHLRKLGFEVYTNCEAVAVS